MLSSGLVSVLDKEVEDDTTPGGDEDGADGDRRTKWWSQCPVLLYTLSNHPPHFCQGKAVREGKSIIRPLWNMGNMA
jgi:hypothetical protein